MEYISNLSNIMMKKSSKRRRESSYDRSGGNDDRYYIAPNEKRVIFDYKGTGIINHI